MVYRNVRAELRRLHWEAPWELGGVVLDGSWRPAADGLTPPSVRTIEAGNVIVLELPAVLAADVDTAARIAIDLARAAGWPVAYVASSRWIELAPDSEPRKV